MTGIKVDPEWIKGYASTVARSGSELGTARDTLRSGQLPAEAFGELGRNTGTDKAYQQAAKTLQDQLSRAVDALNSASAALSKTAEHFSSHDEDVAASIRRAGGR
ncbi:hypothetical protein GCM10010174_08520 [Kutzneria viridogrisea]|uniref:ESX-1 secretion-associated protein n=2 Tax=Kutzneria TaxID=43356 RepID=W5WTQ8_9PSEU|nr:hypothetical protein [Kutzneria albida]AHI01545.1 hypothetical protein KALB_8187 [Kutzneria albida DSM 43870]MBA8931509.1 uncharacterized protein YukE [Kutzneria viridogrisea]